MPSTFQCGSQHLVAICIIKDSSSPVVDPLPHYLGLALCPVSFFLYIHRLLLVVKCAIATASSLHHVALIAYCDLGLWLLWTFDVLSVDCISLLKVCSVCGGVTALCFPGEQAYAFLANKFTIFHPKTNSIPATSADIR